MNFKPTGVITFWWVFEVLPWAHSCQDCHHGPSSHHWPWKCRPVQDLHQGHRVMPWWRDLCYTSIFPSSLEDVELYWYLLEIFTDHDLDKDGIIKMSEFPTMMNEFLTVQKKLNLPVPPEGQYDVLFKKYDSRNDGRPSADEWMSLVLRKFARCFSFRFSHQNWHKIKFLQFYMNFFRK